MSRTAGQPVPISFEPRLQALPHGRRIAEQPIAEQVEGCDARGGTDRVAREGGTMGARRPGPDRFTRQEGADRHAGGNALGRRDDVRLDARVLDGPPAAGASHPGLDLVDHEQDAVLVADLAQAAQERDRRGKVSALALHRLDHDGGHVAGCNDPPEDRAAQHLELSCPVASRLFAPGAHAGERRVMDHRQQRAKASALLDLRIGEAEGAHGAAVERAFECDDPGPMGVIARELDGALDRLGSRVGEEDSRRFRERGDRGQPLREFQVAGLVEIRGRDVDQAFGLVLDGGHHVGVRVPCGGNGDASGKVQKPIAVHVRDRHTASRFGDQRVRARQARTDDSCVAGDEVASLRPGQLGDDVRRFC